MYRDASLGIDARDRVSWQGNVVGADGTVITTTPNTWPWALNVAPTLDEDGADRSGNQVATGTLTNGTSDGVDCLGGGATPRAWVANNGTPVSFGTVGNPATWLQDGTDTCSTDHCLYCVSR